MTEKNLFGGLKCAALVALTMGLALGARAENVAEVTPSEAAASVTTNGVTTFYSTLTEAWTEACQEAGTVATVTMLKDVAVASGLTTGWSGTLTLDLNDHVLAYVGKGDDSIIWQGGGTLHVVDTATTRTPHYFTCDATTGLWTLTNEKTELTVEGGLLTGARDSAIYYNSGAGAANSISNVNFVGNASTSNGGAVTTSDASVGFAITDCTFLGNLAANNGGAVSGGNFTMTDCRVEANVAEENGGGVYVRNHATLVRTKVVNNKAKTGGGVYLTNDPGSGCFPAGVKILMADGSEKAVEEVAEGDVVATFDHVGGTNSSAAVFYVYRGAGAQDVFTLSFASGAKLDVADRHDLLLETTRKYVTVSSDNARTFIGQRFYNYATGGWDELTDVTATTAAEAHYSLYTRGHANCVANGLLTVPDDKDCFINVYELDANLKADAAQLAADIATYGLAKPADYPNVPLDDFEDGNNRYARIAIGKGLTTQVEILYWNEFDYGPIVTKKAKKALKMTTSSVDVALPNSTYLQVGEGVVVTGNVTTAGAVSNVHLDRQDDAVIAVLPDTTDLDIGVTLSSGLGVFGWTNSVNYASSFTSDSSEYRVVYTAEKTLELVPFDAVARSVKTDGESSVTSYHSSLAEAVDAIGADGVGTVTMLADVTMTEPGAAWVPDGSNLTLDLAGRKIEWTTTKGDSLLYFAAGTDGKLTITDSGVGGMISSYCDSSEVTNSALIAFCAGNGDLTVNGGTFVCSNKVGAATLFFKNGTGDWTFNGGTYKALGEGAGGAHFLYCKAASGTTRITGGTYDIRATASAGAGIASNDECLDKITVTGGDFDVITTGAWGGAFSCRNGSLLVNGGDFCVTSSVAGVSCILAERSGTTILSNGTFRAVTTDGYAYAACATETASLTIAGGTYSSKAKVETAASVVGKEQSKVTIVGNPVINNGETEGTAWNLAVQLFGAKLDFSGYTGSFPSLAVFADGKYGPSYVTGDMTKFDNAWIWAGYYSTYPNDGWVQEGRRAFANTNEQTKAAYPWFIDDAVTFTPTAVGHTTATVLTNGAAMAAAGSYVLQINAANVKVVYTAETGYFFIGHMTAVTNDVNTTKNPATADAPAEPLPAVRVGNDAWAQIAGGVCAVFGTGDMWNADGWPSGVNPLAAYRKEIASVVFEPGVTSAGEAMLYKFYAVTNVTLAASVTNIAGHAFYNCHSLRSITFQGAAPALGEQAIKFTAAIRMDGSTPVVYTIPSVTSPNRKLMGKRELTDADWTEIAEPSAKGDYRFFKVVVE